MGKVESVEEKPKKDIAKEVITPKRKYFLPATGEVKEAESIGEITKEK